MIRENERWTSNFYRYSNEILVPVGLKSFQFICNALVSLGLTMPCALSHTLTSLIATVMLALVTYVSYLPEYYNCYTIHLQDLQRMWNWESVSYFLRQVYVNKKIEKVLNEWTCDKIWKFVRGCGKTWMLFGLLRCIIYFMMWHNNKCVFQHSKSTLGGIQDLGVVGPKTVLATEGQLRRKTKFLCCGPSNFLDTSAASYSSTNRVSVNNRTLPYRELKHIQNTLTIQSLVHLSKAWHFP